jgi:hypothetical protein
MADEVEEKTEDQAGAGNELEVGDGEVTPEEAAALEEKTAATDVTEKAEKITFTPEQQAVFDKRLGKEIAKREKAEQAAEAAREEAESAKGKVSEHEAAVAQGLHLHPAFVAPDELRVISTVNAAEAEHAALGEVAGEDEVEVAALPEATQAWLKKTHPGATTVQGRNLSPRMAQLTQVIAREGAKADAVYSAAKAKQMAALKLGMQIIKLRAEAARKVKAQDGKKDDDGKPRGAQVTLRSVSRPLESAGATRKGGIDRTKLAAGGFSTQALMEAMGD